MVDRILGPLEVLEEREPIEVGTRQQRARPGHTAITGSPLDDPEGAEVHVAIAPHGRV